MKSTEVTKLKFIDEQDALPTKPGNDGLDLTVIRETFDLCKESAEAMGLKGSYKAFAILRGVKSLTGVDLAEAMGAHNLIAPDQGHPFTVTELGKRYALTGLQFNKLLAAQGFQYKTTKGEWCPTDKGKPYAIYTHAARPKGFLFAERRLCWSEGVLGVLKAEKGVQDEKGN